MEAVRTNSTDAWHQGIWRQRRVVLSVLLIALAIAGLYLLVAAPTYRSTARLLVRNPAIEPLTGSARDRSATIFLNNQCEILKSTQILAVALSEPSVVECKALAKVGDDQRFAYLRDRLVCQPGREDDSISVSLTTSNASDSAAIVNAVVNAYVGLQTQQRKESEQSALGATQDAWRAQQAQLLAAQDRLNELQATRGTHPVDGASNEQTGLLEALTQRLGEARMATVNAKSAYDDALALIAHSPELQAQVQKQVQSGAAALLSEPEANAIKAQLMEARLKLREAERKYLPTHSAVQSLTAQLREHEVAFVSARAAQFASAQNREADLLASYKDLEKKAQESIRSAKEYAQVTSELQGLTKESAALDAKLKQIAHEQEQQATTVTITFPATPSLEPASPRKAMTWSIATGVGLILGMFIARGRDRAMAGLRTPAEIRASLAVPVVGAIPSLGHLQNKAFAAMHPTSPAAEAYRSIRTAIFTGLSKDNSRTLLVTSANGQEGKSTVVCNLSIILAESSQRTLIIDCDFRSPKQHRHFGLNDEVGLAGVLAGEELLDEAIQRTAIENLHVICAGAASRNPAELINQPIFAEILEQLGTRYDRILIDSPPVMMYADARIISAATDLTLLVIQPSKSGTQMVQIAKDGLLAVGANLIGVAVNAVDFRSSQSFGGLGYFAPAALPNNKELSDEEASTMVIHG